MTVLTSTEITEGLQSDLSAVTEQISRTQEYIDRYLPSVLSFGLRLLFAVIVFLVGARLIKLLRKFIRRSMERAGADVGLMQFLDSLLKVIFYFVLIMLIASGFGVDTTSVMALVGSAGLTIGLAFQGSLSNFAGGVLLLLIKPFKVGDYIIYVADNLEGTVTEVQMFYTTLLTADNRRVVIPNGVLSNNSLVNVTAQDKRRLDIDVGIGYDSDLKLAKELCEKLLNQEEKILDDQEHIVVVDSLADSAVMLKLRFWVRPEDYWNTKWRMTEKVKILFDENGIEIPFNQVDVNIKSAGASD
ncbi:mechanosensitive ion channel family protein [Lachnoclostridium sp. An138]|uniref:mechanosensitive ion channel family protein n=1 Tax=Lachnoclostridium sp. An138 TaxID=1965560 RepID=UPI000B39B77B|nr:mechanosensitive ion channel family protein [Lachnoclostridium sp. An138]OUQ20725.1 mechanosensitive ion channel protein [Lachnoclostridium sp. An138]